MSWPDCVFQSWLALRFGEPPAGFNNWEHLECFPVLSQRSDHLLFSVQWASIFSHGQEHKKGDQYWPPFLFKIVQVKP